ncbi:imidazole glycerol phosphate synthase subunit HisF [[Haemophilus] felis]|uniref:imidazole glycerol-phosphate synthase n=1 Tax=[Haemophilus] felis TaxID=123822 RepID=A0A1T0ATZ8_9PAST|nr:imidazole glycerol phosphate synthase subunit HisF [[Haemophilus] felis]NBI41346.1 imidazole glycerol phosphate synthase subunit HisF [[Haemophilus] felis]OOS00212.1 imidazole glycerol phosphate synthase subunit HisF [[Haemophilus] felis]
MLAKRIIPCLDVKDGKVVKGMQFRHHEIIGDIIPLAQRYAEEGADELIFYDMTSSVNGSDIDKKWTEQVAQAIDIPFCVVGDIKNVEDAAKLFALGADKVAVGSTALADPDLINHLADRFGVQSIVVGVNIWFEQQTGEYRIDLGTGNKHRIGNIQWQLLDWVQEVEKRGAGEIVINVANQDGVRLGYDIELLKLIRATSQLPLIASGGAGEMAHFRDVFLQADVDGALAASVFHKEIVDIRELKAYLHNAGVNIRK